MLAQSAKACFGFWEQEIGGLLPILLRLLVVRTPVFAASIRPGGAGMQPEARLTGRLSIRPVRRKRIDVGVAARG